MPYNQKIIDIKHINQAPKKQNKGNTIIARSIAEITFKNKDGKEEIKIYSVIQPEDIYEAIKNKAEKIDISDCLIPEFDSDKLREYLGVSKDRTIEIDEFIASNSVFKDVAKFYDIDFLEKTTFNNSFFLKETEFITTNFFDYTDFSDSIFENYSTFGGSTFSKTVIFDFTTFLDIATFTTGEFLSDSHFFAVTFSKYTTFNYAQFSKNADFSNTNFSGNTDFSHSIFSDSVDFNNSLFRNQVSFAHTVFTGVVDFCDMRIQQEGDFKSCKLFQIANFFNLEAKEIKLNGTIFEKSALFKDCQIENADRETFRIIKHELLKSNNKLDAYDYFKREMDEKKNELSKYSIERFFLSCYKFVNDYGTNFKKGILVTLALFVLFTTLFLNFGINNSYFEWGWNGWDEFYEVTKTSIKYGKELFHPAHRTNNIHGGDFNICGLFMHAALRIYVPMMYFFILQPFKKFKSW